MKRLLALLAAVLGSVLRYTSDKIPAKLDALIKGLDAILARGTWTRVVYEWEKQAGEHTPR